VKPRFTAKPRSGENEAQARSFRWRSSVVLGLVVLGAAGLAARAVELQLLDHGFLAKQGDDRSMRVVKIAAHRGAITDRTGEPLAISTPVDSVWVNPQELNDNIDQLPKLAKALKQDPQFLARRITSNLDREFLYLVRHMPPIRQLTSRRWEFPASTYCGNIDATIRRARWPGTRSASPPSTTRARRVWNSDSISC